MHLGLGKRVSEALVVQMSPERARARPGDEHPLRLGKGDDQALQVRVEVLRALEVHGVAGDGLDRVSCVHVAGAVRHEDEVRLAKGVGRSRSVEAGHALGGVTREVVGTIAGLEVGLRS